MISFLLLIRYFNVNMNVIFHFKFNNYLRYLTHYITQSSARSLFSIFIPIYLLANGFSLFEVGVFYLAQECINFVFSSILFKRIHILGIRNTTIYAVLAQIILVALTYEFLAIEYTFLLLLAFLRGFHDSFYWGPYAIFLVHLSDKKTGRFLGRFHFFTAVAQLVIVPLAGFALDHYSAFWLVVLSIFIYLLSIIPLLKLTVSSLRDNRPLSFSSIVTNAENRYIVGMSHLNEFFTKINDTLIPLFIYFLFSTYFSAGVAIIFVILGEGLYSYFIGSRSDNSKKRKLLVFLNIIGYLLLLFSLAFASGMSPYILYILIIGLAFFRIGSWIAAEAGINKRIKPEYQCSKKMMGRLGENLAGIAIGFMVIVAGISTFEIIFLAAFAYILFFFFVMRKKYLNYV